MSDKNLLPCTCTVTVTRDPRTLMSQSKATRDPACRFHGPIPKPGAKEAKGGKLP